MILESTRLSSVIQQKQEELLARKKDLKAVQEHVGYVKLLAAKYLETETKTVNREQSLRYLTSLLEELKKYNKEQKSVDLANFQIDDKKITLQWTVSALKDIYSEWWIIDRFAGYPFIQFFNVPYYRQSTIKAWYEFLLDADIYHYDWTDPTS